MNKDNIKIFLVLTIIFAMGVMSCYFTGAKYKTEIITEEQRRCENFGGEFEIFISFTNGKEIPVCWYKNHQIEM